MDKSNRKQMEDNNEIKKKLNKGTNEADSNNT